MQNGFPTHMEVSDLVIICKEYLVGLGNDPMDNNELRTLFHVSGLTKTDYKFGNTKIFFRAGKQIMLIEKITNHSDSLVTQIRKLVLRSIWRTLIITTLFCTTSNFFISYSYIQILHFLRCFLFN